MVFVDEAEGTTMYTQLKHIQFSLFNNLCINDPPQSERAWAWILLDVSDVLQPKERYYCLRTATTASPEIIIYFGDI